MSIVTMETNTYHLYIFTRNALVSDAWAVLKIDLD